VRSLKELAEASRHPLVITIIGFILTGIGGAGFTWWLNSLSNARDVQRVAEVRRAEFEAAGRARDVEAVREVTDLINERRTRAMLVASAIHRRSSGAEIESRKAAYDDVYVRWNTKAQSISLRIREIFKALAPSAYEGYINALTNEIALGHRTAASRQTEPQHQGLLTLMDTCITNAFDAYRRDRFEDTTDAVKVLSDCDIDEIDFRLIDCSRIIADSLFVIVNTLDQKFGEKKIRTDAADIKGACSPPSHSS
jgi:hypothetical protein